MWTLKIQQISEYNKKRIRLKSIELKIVVTRGERDGGVAYTEGGVGGTRKLQRYIAQHGE